MAALPVLLQLPPRDGRTARRAAVQPVAVGLLSDELWYLRLVTEHDAGLECVVVATQRQLVPAVGPFCVEHGGK